MQLFTYVLFYLNISELVYLVKKLYHAKLLFKNNKIHQGNQFCYSQNNTYQHLIRVSMLQNCNTMRDSKCRLNKTKCAVTFKVYGRLRGSSHAKSNVKNQDAQTLSNGLVWSSEQHSPLEPKQSSFSIISCWKP